jgi:hypothetical protein
MAQIAAAGPVAELIATGRRLEDDSLAEIFAKYRDEAARDEDDYEPPGDLEKLVKAVGDLPPELWVGQWRGIETGVTGRLWPAVDAVARALLTSPRALLYAEVSVICEAALATGETGS